MPTCVDGVCMNVFVGPVKEMYSPFGTDNKAFLILSGQTKVLTLVCVSSRHDVDSGDGESHRCGTVRTTDGSVG